MHPTTGALPAGSGANEPNSGATKWYAPQADFAATYTGPSFTTAAAGFDAGSGAGPFGYALVDYWTNSTTAGVPAEWTAFGTTLTTPPNNKYTGYFRTTFTVPADGLIYTNPKIRCIFDDGAFIYLDGVLVARCNVGAIGTAGVADNYTSLAANTTNTESGIRVIDLNLAALAQTGAGTTPAAAAIANNTTVITRVSSLAPGEHTLAISAHNQAVGSSDLTMAAQLIATGVNCSITPVASAVRVDNSTPALATDDTATFSITVGSSGVVSASGWKITAPASLVGQTGAYGTPSPVTISGVALTDFVNGAMTITFEDADNALCTATASVNIPVALGVNNMASGKIILSNGAATTNWAFNETTLTSTQTAATQADHEVLSELIDLSTVGYTQVTADLDAISGGSSGFEAADHFYMQVFIDGSATPISILGATDSDNNGSLDGNAATSTELPGNTEPNISRPFSFSYLLPATANSVRLRFVGNTNSGSETLVVKNIKLDAPPAGIVAVVGTTTFDNKGTDAAADDTFGAPVLVDGISLAPSTIWDSNRIDPDQGTYGTTSNFFGLFSDGVLNVTLSDRMTPAITQSFSIQLPAQSFTATPAAAITRVENGAGPTDDTVTFTTTITGVNGGPSWKATVPAP